MCAVLPTIEVATRVVVIMHYREWHKPTATAPLAQRILPSCEIRLRGSQEVPFSQEGLVEPGRRTLVLYPDEGARLLTPELVAEDSRPVTLIVPDGSWRQASKIPRRVAALRDAERVVLADDAPTRYRLRFEPKPRGLATFEAIARALGVLEGPSRGPAVRAELEQAFEALIDSAPASRSGVMAARAAAEIRSGAIGTGDVS